MAEIDHAERLRKRAVNNPTDPEYGSKALNYLGSLPGKTGDLIFSGVDAARNMYNQSGDQRLQPGIANTKADTQGFLSNRIEDTASLGGAVSDYFTKTKPAGSSSFDPIVEQINKEDKIIPTEEKVAPPNDFGALLGESPQVTGSLATPVKGEDGFTAYNNQYAFKQDPNGGALQIKDGSGKGTIDFGSPELNAKYAKKMRKSKGTVNYMDTSKFGDSIASDTAGKIVQAVRDGHISPSRGIELHDYALRNTSFRKQEALDQQRQQAELTRLGKSSPSKPEKIYTPFVDNESGQTRFLNETSGFTKGKEIEQQQGRTKRVMKAYTQANPEEKQKIIMRYPELFGG